jgi:hypothetical protein
LPIGIRPIGITLSGDLETSARSSCHVDTLPRALRDGVSHEDEEA